MEFSFKQARLHRVVILVSRMPVDMTAPSLPWLTPPSLLTFLPAAKYLSPPPSSCCQADLGSPVCFRCFLPPWEIPKSGVRISFLVPTPHFSHSQAHRCRVAQPARALARGIRTQRVCHWLASQEGTSSVRFVSVPEFLFENSLVRFGSVRKHTL